MNKENIIAKIKECIEKSPKRKFKQNIDLTLNFSDVQMEGEHKLNLNILLPKGRGKDVEIGVFADGDMNLKAKEVSKHVLDKKELEGMASDKRGMRKYAGECYGFIASSDLLPVVGKNWGVVLGVRGKMPQPVPPNADVKAAIERSKNTVRIKSKKNPNIHVPVGTEDNSPEELFENIQAVYISVERVIHEEKIKSAFIKTTMGSAVRLW
ncbi:MAG: 50S ribosomal protein L1 [Candidatus Altiarchaeota archaeon]